MLLSYMKSSRGLQLMYSATGTRLLTTYSKNPQIYIHENPPKHYNFSLSKKPNSIVIGSSQSMDPKPSTFYTNPKFQSILQMTMKKKIYDDFTFIMEAGTNANSYMPIYDFREIPRYSRTPYIGDVFGYVQIDNEGKMIPQSWQKNDMYEVCSGKTGLCKFSEFMYETLREECERDREN
ncbi:hypothetical protein KGF56_002446 [Candida oxycetoniae]|uniref:Uncharacterized protein n=1 Tax=Candida oxycetoniae TaxID=497107 RepID=A0AAI9SXD4_9ASCO|nr:uncharacterized protein KGF56_002446 [Candida oxycetoniae]KAI3404743.1 hypothetical protein KGF56_002446 [Candida oxycetoniae]